MTRYAIIDLGSNTVRLVIFEVSQKTLEAYRDAWGPHARNKGQRVDKPSKLFTEVLDEKKTAGLSAYVADGTFSERGIDKAAEILESFVRTAKGLDCKHTDIFATAVLRNCDNSAEAHRTLEKRIDHRIHLLSAKEEAHLGFVGAAFEKPIGTGALIDIGGGSTELTRIEEGHARKTLSLPQGSVSSYARFVRMILPTPKECAEIAGSLRSQLLADGSLSDYQVAHAYGIGGSVRALAKLYAGLFANGRKQRIITAQQIEQVFAVLEDDPSTFAHQVTKSAPDRIHTVVPGSVIALALMRLIGAEELEICRYGIREGYLVERVLGLGKKA